MAVTKFGRNYDALCGKTIRAPAVASADFVDSLKRPILADMPVPDPKRTFR